MFRMLSNIALFLSLILFLSGCDNSKEFRFAWLSDTHVSATTTGEEDLQAAVQDINSLGNIDFVLVTGDITDMNIGNNLQTAKNVLDELHMPYHIIPGNHDTKWTDSGNGNFINLWGDDKFIFDYDGIKFIGMHQGPELRMADGHFAPHDLRWLDSLLTHLPDKNQPIIFVTHYPIDPSIDNYDVFLDEISGYNFRMVLHGHGHRNRSSEYYGIPGVMGRSSLRARDSVGGFTIADVHSDSICFSERTTGVSTGKPWARLPLFKPEYTVNTSEIIRPDFSVNDTFPQVQPVWKIESQNLMAASPVVSGNTIYIGDAAGNMYALALKDGSKKWTFKTGYKIYGTAAVSGNSLAFTCADNNIYCLDNDTGKQNWLFETDMPDVAVPMVEDNVIYVGGSDSTFRAIDLDSGTLRWEFAGVKGYIESKPLIYENKVIFTAWDETVYALNKDDGSLAWTWAEGRPHMLYSPAACWPVSANGKVFIVAPDRFMTAIDSKTGKTIWRSNKYKVRESIGISENSRLVYGECMNDTVFAVDSQSNQFKPVWIKDFKYGYDIAPSMLESKDGTVYFGTKNGLIIAFDEKSGKLKWKHKTGNTVINTVTPIDGNTVLFSNMDGEVVLLKNNPSVN
jgi:outer membrane protein assembly factor BamB/predicted phosphodiesterase